MILCIETATDICSVALCTSTGIISVRRSSELRSHATSLTVYIKEILEEQDLRAEDLEAVAVGKGPGSFTGLRIGAAVAKGLSFAAGIPIIGIDSLTILFHGFTESEEGMNYRDSETLFCPMIDARRMEAYYCLFGSSGERLTEISAGVISGSSFLNFADDKKIVFFGPGSEKFINVIKHPGRVFIKGFESSADFMRMPAYAAFKSSDFENTVSFEPFYLKDFIATKPTRKIV